jgi:hypothetical protein
MSQQKSAYFLIAVSFVLGMIATTSISGCDSGTKSDAAKSGPPKSSLDGEGSSQIKLDKPLDSSGSAPATGAPAADAPAAESPAAAPPTDAPAAEQPAAAAPAGDAPAAPPAPAAGGN